METVVPNLGENAYSCPLCHAYSRQQHFKISKTLFGYGGSTELNGFFASQCDRCEGYSFWRMISRDESPVFDLIYPNVVIAPLPADDLPEEIKVDFEEARQILRKSPRGAAALLRLAIQKLCKHLGEPGKDINTDIASLAQKGLDPMIVQCLDIVRVVGNESVHPGSMDLNDTPEVALELFGLVNLIVEEKITRPKKIKNLFGLLPAEKRKGIEKRDQGNK